MRWKCGLEGKNVVVLFVTSQDLKQIGDLVEKKLDERLVKFEDKLDKKLDQRFEKQEDKLDKKLNERFEKQEEKFDKKLDERDQKLLPAMSKLMDVKLENYGRELEDKLFNWKSEVIDAVDALACEMKDSQDFRLITTNQIVENRERIDRLEKKVFGAVSSI